MSTTWLDVPGSTLASKSDAIDFTTAAAPAFISVGLGAGRVEEIAFRDGAFVYPYLGSTRTGNTVSLRRTGGWPKPPTVRVEESQAVLTAAYTPVDVTAWGQWTMDPQPLKNGYVNRNPGRVNNLLGMSLGSEAAAPDIVPGAHCLVNTASGANSMIGGVEPQTANMTPNLGAGAHTLCGRFYVSFFVDPQTLFGLLGDYPQARTAMGILAGITNNRVYAMQYGNPVAVAPTLVWPRDGDWHYASVRRLADGSIRFGIDGNFETVAAGAHSPPMTGTAVVFHLGHQPSGYGLPGASNGRGLTGGIADTGAWTRALSDAEIKALASTSLGRAIA